VSTPVRDVFTRAEEEHDAMKIQEMDIQDYARQLLEAHGAHAVVEAAQKACAFEMEGKKEDAEIWRHIEAAMKLMRGPHES
jgi:predicted small metal-binding protein